MSLRALDCQKPLERFLEIKAEIARLERELARLKPAITDALIDEPENACDFLGHRIELGQRKAYRYSDDVANLDKTLREMKERERLSGKAVVLRWTSFPVVTPLKTLARRDAHRAA